MHGLRTWEWTCETWLYLATESGWRERPVGPRQKMPDDMSGTLNRHVNLVTVGWYILAIVQLKRSTTVWWLNKRSQSFPSATVQTYHLRFGKHLCFCRSEVESWSLHWGLLGDMLISPSLVLRPTLRIRPHTALFLRVAPVAFWFLQFLSECSS